MGFVKYIRKTKEGVELATLRMESPQGRSVTLIGVQHIATQESWDRDIATLRQMEADGTHIFLEGVRPVEGTVTDDEWTRVAALAEFAQTSAVLAEVTGLIFQKDAFEAAETTWTPYDVSILDIVRELKPRTVRRIQKISQMDTEALKSQPELVLAILRLLPSMPGFLSLVLSGDLSKHIVKRRNEYAVEGVLLSSASDRALYWGAAHLPGMVKLLRERGYNITSEEWRVVLPASYTVPTCKEPSGAVTSEDD